MRVRVMYDGDVARDVGTHEGCEGVMNACGPDDAAPIGRAFLYLLSPPGVSEITESSASV